MVLELQDTVTELRRELAILKEQQDAQQQQSEETVSKTHF